MKTTDLFKNNRAAKRINESLAKTFGRKLNLESFDLPKLEDARNKLRTQVHTARSAAGFNETLENDAVIEAQWILDAINSEIAERQEFISAPQEQYGEADSGQDNYDKILNAIAALYGDDIWDNDSMQDLANDLMQAGPSDNELDFIIAKGKLPRRLADIEFTDNDSVKFGEQVAVEGVSPEVEATMVEIAEGRQELEDGLDGLLGYDAQLYLQDMLADIFSDQEDNPGRDNREILEIMMDYIVQEYGRGTQEQYGEDMTRETEGENQQRQSRYDNIHATLTRAAKAGSDGYDLVDKGLNGVLGPDVLKYLQDMYVRISHDNGIDPDDDFEKIQDIMSDWLQDEYKGGQYGESMTRVTEGEIQQASAIVTAKTMVDRVGRWIEELSGMENDTLLTLGDSIRDEMGQEQAKQFISSTAPAIRTALENLRTTREALASSVRSLTGEEQSPEMLGGTDSDAGALDDTNLGPAEPDAMNPEDPFGDEFDAAEPAIGGAETAGRAKRESIDFGNRLMKVLAG